MIATPSEWRAVPSFCVCAVCSIESALNSAPSENATNIVSIAWPAGIRLRPARRVRGGRDLVMSSFIVGSLMLTVASEREVDEGSHTLRPEGVDDEEREAHGDPHLHRRES
jgi:hypothetical protein